MISRTLPGEDVNEDVDFSYVARLGLAWAQLAFIFITMLSSASFMVLLRAAELRDWLRWGEAAADMFLVFERQRQEVGLQMHPDLWIYEIL
mmetsp:Transcript_2876/g.6124  ORF Transcript_2876/g.6124 Transcript_2876/m.6124 type:complete len:91 (+) Transcript_2876:466-738(+)